MKGETPAERLENGLKSAIQNQKKKEKKVEDSKANVAEELMKTTMEAMAKGQVDKIMKVALKMAKIEKTSHLYFGLGYQGDNFMQAKADWKDLFQEGRCS